MIINNNIPALNTYRQMGVNQNAASNSMEKLASGLRINKAGDDAAGLAISEKMRGQIRGLDQASRNAQDGISMIQTAEGALGETHSILQRMRELATQAANDTNVGVDRNEIQKEMNALTSEINRIGNTTEFNTQKLLNGGAAEGAALTAETTGTGAVTLATIEPVAEVRGEYSFDLTLPDATETGTLTIGGEAIAIAADGSIGDVVDTINANANLNERFEATFDGTTITLTEKEGAATGTDFADTDIEVAGTGTAKANFSVDTESTEAVAGGQTLTIGTAFAAGDTLEIGGQTITFGDDSADIDVSVEDDATKQAAALATLLAGQDGIDSAVASTNTIAITEAAPAPGAGFSANFQIGANSGQSLTLNIADMRSVALKVSGNTSEGTVTAKNDSVASYVEIANVTDGTNNTSTEFALDVSSHEKAAAAISVINDAIEAVSAERSNLGATQNRLEHTISNLGTSAENLQAAESRIRDVDMAREVMEMTKNNILSQASQAMLAQANQAPQSVLQLLG